MEFEDAGIVNVDDGGCREGEGGGAKNEGATEERCVGKEAGQGGCECRSVEYYYGWFKHLDLSSLDNIDRGVE